MRGDRKVKRGTKSRGGHPFLGERAGVLLFSARKKENIAI
jgi:hypothetical protein